MSQPSGTSGKANQQVAGGGLRLAELAGPYESNDRVRCRVEIPKSCKTALVQVSAPIPCCRDRGTAIEPHHGARLRSESCPRLVPRVPKPQTEGARTPRITKKQEPLAKLHRPDELTLPVPASEMCCRCMSWHDAIHMAIWTHLDRQFSSIVRSMPPVRAYVTSRISCSTVTTRMPNIRWQNTLAAPRTRTWLPPLLSFRLPLTRSAELRWL